MRKFAVLIIVLCLAPTVAAEGDRDREIEAIQNKIHAMLREANRLEEEGHERKAEELRHKAKEMHAKLEAHLKKSKKGKPRHGDRDLEKIMKGLHAGMQALRALGGQEEALHRLEKVAVNLKKEMAQREHKRRGGDREREMAHAQLKTMRVAMHALLRREKRDAAELMERAMHSLELRLEGRRDKEALAIYEKTPSTGQMVELLAFASEILADMKQKDLAHQVGALAKQYRARWEREQKGRREREPRRETDRRRREGDRERDRDRAHAEHLERAMERIERLEQRLAELTRVLERMQRDRERR